MSRVTLPGAVFFAVVACGAAWRLYARGGVSVATLVLVIAAAFAAGAGVQRHVASTRGGDAVAAR